MARTWASVADLARTYRISESTVRNKIASGAWPADRIPSDSGKRHMIRFSPEQQDEIERSIRHGKRRNRKRGWLNDALSKTAV